MEGLTLKGRGFHAPNITTSADEFGVLIRAEDERYEEVWIELRFTHAALGELVERVLAHGGIQCHAAAEMMAQVRANAKT